MGTCSYSWKQRNEKGDLETKHCYENTWEGSEKYCIFHDPSPEKNSELFQQEIEEQFEKKEYSFAGYCFPKGWSLENRKFEGDVNFEGVTFQGNANFWGVTFHGTADFEGVTFHGTADFEGVTFHGTADFREATFQGTADFWGVTFQDANFWGVTFQDAHFRGVTFKSANFWGVTFKSANFERATFQNARFGGAIFQDFTSFGGATFHGTANFWGVTFQDARFGGATFQGNANFSETTFQDASFGGATFQDALFLAATFTGTANFRETTFQATVDFWEATFQATADFWGATFKSALFLAATFTGTANFREATFQGTADFREATFQATADFREATAEKTFKFVPVKNQYLDLQDSEFFFRGSITADLSKARFHGAYLENIAFIDCGWPQEIYEEVHMNDRDVHLSFKELETIYRDLKQNMQRHGNYSKAGVFYYREMECKKRAMREKRFSPDWLKSYVYSFLKYTCGYGEKPERVIFTSILIIFAAAFLFVLKGIVIGEYTSEEYIINYNLSLSLPGIQAVKDFLHCLYYSVVTFTTLGYGDIHPVGLSKLVASAEAFTGAFFIALFVLVFGRKMIR